MSANEAQVLVFLDPAMRFSAFGMLVLLTVLLLRDAGRSWAGCLSASFTLGVNFYLLCSYGPARALAGPLLFPLETICTAVPALLWLATQAIFVDGFRPRLCHLGIIAALEALGPVAAAIFGESSPLFSGISLGHHALAAVLYGHALYVAWAGRLDDLVEARREFRRFFVGLTAILGLAVIGVEVAQGRSPAPAGLETLAAAAVLASTIVLSLAAIRIDAGHLFLPAVPLSAERPEASVDVLAPANRHILDLIRNAMEVDRLYRREGLTISTFAQTLQVPEHQLRRTINAGLGYRNFNAFLNHFRISEIKTVLADPARARTPILTLAMDVGYGSLAPFNRAFKELVGLTPSAYRKLKLGTADEGGMAIRSPSPQN